MKEEADQHQIFLLLVKDKSVSSGYNTRLSLRKFCSLDLLPLDYPRIICKDQISVVVKLKFLFQWKIPFQNAKFRIVKLVIRPCGCLQCVRSVLASLVLVEKMFCSTLPLSAALPELCTMQETSRTLRVKKSLNKISVLNQGKSIISGGKFIWIWLTRAVLTADYTIITENRFIFNMLYKPHK